MGKGGSSKGSKASATGGGAKGVRTPINGPRQTGTILEWKGAFGWIQPSKPINHPKAQAKQGKVYLAAEDVKEELEGVGAKVSFNLYSDNSGLGAADCKMVSSAQVAVSKPQPKAHAKGNAKGNSKGKVTSVLPTWTKSAMAVQKTAFQKKAAAPQPQQRQTQKGGGKGSTERKLIHNAPLKGTVIQWRGKFGWVKPNDTIDHPMANKHQGDLFMGHQDVEQEISGVGAKVRFYLYESDKGLCVGNVKPA